MNREDIAGLLARLEAATGAANYRLDAMIHAVFEPGAFDTEDEATHYASYPETNHADRRYLVGFVPRYTASLDAARGLLLGKLPGPVLIASGCMEEGPFCRIIVPDANGSYGGGYLSANGTTECLAILIALLRTLQAKDKP